MSSGKISTQTSSQTVPEILVALGAALDAIVHDANIVSGAANTLGPLGVILKSAGDQIHSNAFEAILLLRRVKFDAEK